jgi:hypothetical protein
LDSPFVAIPGLESLTKPPRKLTPFHQYLKMYYEERIKDEYSRRFQDATMEYDCATEEERESGVVPRPWAVKIRNEVGRELWNQETESFRKEVAQAAEDAHAKAVKEWKDSMLTPRTPQQHHQ